MKIDVKSLYKETSKYTNQELELNRLDKKRQRFEIVWLYRIK